MIPIKAEPKGLKGIKNCHFCLTQTRFWHIPTNTPICIGCSQAKDPSDIYKKTNLLSDNHLALKKWFDLFKRIEDTYNTLKLNFGATPESPVVSVMYDVFKEHTTLLSEKLGDESNWLEWFIFDNDCGKREFEAKATRWPKHRKIKTLGDLEKLITDSQVYK